MSNIVIQRGIDVHPNTNQKISIVVVHKWRHEIFDILNPFVTLVYRRHKILTLKCDVIYERLKFLDLCWLEAFDC